MKKLALLAAALAIAAPSAQAAEPVTLKLAFPPPPISFFNGKVLAPWGKEIEEATGGAVKVQIFVGPSLANFGNIYDRILNGVADLGWGLHGPLGTTFRKTGVTNLPGIPATGPQCSAAVWRLYSSGVIADEYEKVKPLSLSCFPPTSIISPKPIRAAEDLKGLKISVGSRLNGQGMELLGAAPISMTTSEIYQSLQRGTVDASVIGWAATAAFKLHEVVRFYFEAPIGLTTNFLLMNKESFAKLPAAAQKAIESKSGGRLSAIMGKGGHDETMHGRHMVSQMPGHTITTMPDAELERLQRTMAPLVDQWMKETPDGAKVLAAYKAELAKAGAMK